MENIAKVVSLLTAKGEMEEWQAEVLTDLLGSITDGGSVVGSQFFCRATEIIYCQEHGEQKINSVASLFVAYPEESESIILYFRVTWPSYVMTKGLGLISFVLGILKGLSMIPQTKGAKEECLVCFAHVVTKPEYKTPNIEEDSFVNGELSNLVAGFLRGETPETLDFEKFLLPICEYVGNLSQEEKERWNKIETFNARIVNEFVYKWYSNLPLSKKMSALSWIDCGKKRKVV